MTLPPVNLRKILLTILFILVTILLALLLYWLFFYRPAVEPPPGALNREFPGAFPEVGENVNRAVVEINVNRGLPAPLNINIALPEGISRIAKGGLTAVTPLIDKKVHGLSLSQDGSSLLYYDQATGKFYKVTTDGKMTALSEKVFHEVEKITWSPDKNKTILEYPDGSNILYDFAKGKQVTLPKHWKEFDFSPQGNEIVSKSIGLDPTNRWLLVSDSDGSKARKIEPLGEKDETVHVNWSPNNQIITMYREAVSVDRQELYFVGLHGENFKSTTLEGRGFQGQWSPSGARLLYSVYSAETDYKPTLWIVGSEGENIGRSRTSLKMQTWASKCVFPEEKTLYCAVPKYLEEGSGIYPQMADNIPDSIYKIDLKSGAKTILADPYGDYTVDQITLSTDGQFLYFTDKKTGKLYKIQLR